MNVKKLHSKPCVFHPRGRHAFRARFLKKQTKTHPLATQVTTTLLAYKDLVRFLFKRILIYGYPGSKALEDLMTHFPQLTLTDVVCPVSLPTHRNGVIRFVRTDLDYLPFRANSFDLIVNMFTLHLSNDIPGLLRQMNVCLRPDGLFLSACFGAESLLNFKRLWLETEDRVCGGIRPRFPPQIQAHHGAMLLQRAGFQVGVCSASRYRLYYKNFMDLIQEIHDWGQWGPLKDKITDGKYVQRILQKLPMQKITADVEVLFLSGRAPSPYQQRALQHRV